MDTIVTYNTLMNGYCLQTEHTLKIININFLLYCYHTEHTLKIIIVCIEQKSNVQIQFYDVYG